jgi:hypothetical protein
LFAPRFCKEVCGSVALALLLALPSIAQQSAGGVILGTITDPVGKSVERATVTLTNVAQGTVRTFTTQNDGVYAFTTLEAANYTLAASAPSGFAPWNQSVVLLVGQALNIPVHLVVAENQTSVKVSADLQQGVDTTSSDLGGVIGARQIDSMPLNGRNYLYLAYLVPGNAPAPNFDPTKVHTVVISSAGQLGRGGSVTIDGADNNDDAVGGSLVNIPEDAVQEFQIASNRFSAGLGRSGSTVVNVVTKQGSNSFHGGLAFFERDAALQALPATYQPVPGHDPTFHRQQYAAYAGGPIRRDKAWWFVAVEDRQQLGADLVGVRDTQNQTITREFATAPLHDFLTTSRLDWQITGRDRVGFRESLELGDDLSQSTLDRALGTAAYRQTAENHLQGLTADWVHTFTPTVVNRVSFAENNFNHTTSPIATTPQITFPDLDDGSTYRVHNRLCSFGSRVTTQSHGP